MGYKLCQIILSQYDPEVLDNFKSEMAQGFDRFFLLSFCLACCWPGLGARNNLRIIRQWSWPEFAFPDEATQNNALQNGDYIPGNNVLIDVDVHHRQGAQQSRIFVTNPRFDKGRPMTLGTVDEMGRISAYPDYSWHNNQGANCDGMTSVFRVAIDECERLWVMDTGKIGEIQHCPPQVLAFNLASDQLIYRHRFNRSIYSEESTFITLVVDLRGEPGNCQDTFVYVADVSGHALAVVDVAQDRSWRVKHRYFYPYPNRGSFTIDGESFDLMDGVFGLALSPIFTENGKRERFLYFHALAATTENVVRASLLRNESFIEHPDADPQSINAFPEERTSQSAAEAIDRNGIMYFGLMDPPSIWCWNTATEFKAQNFHRIALNSETLQFASGVKVVNNLKGEQELWVLTCSFQRVMTGTLTSDRINFRIHAEKIPSILSNSPCKSSPKGQDHGYHANLISPNSRGHSRYGAA